MVKYIIFTNLLAPIQLISYEWTFNLTVISYLIVFLSAASFWPPSFTVKLKISCTIQILIDFYLNTRTSPHASWIKWRPGWLICLTSISMCLLASSTRKLTRLICWSPRKGWSRKLKQKSYVSPKLKKSKTKFLAKEYLRREQQIALRWGGVSRPSSIACRIWITL